MKRSLVLVVLCFTLLMLFGNASDARALTSTGDGSWFWQRPLPQGNELDDVVFVDALQGWAVGASGTILVTKDGGATWASQVSPTRGRLTAVAFPDALHGWAVSYNGIIATDDGGLTWREQWVVPQGAEYGLADVDFADASHGWVAGGQGTILATSDGGLTWCCQASGTDRGLRSVDFVDARHGWIVGFSSTVLATADGGATWEPQDCGTASTFSAVTFADPMHGWAVGVRGRIIATVDGGAAWKEQRPLDFRDATLTSIDFVDENRGWAVDVRGGVIATIDGGVTWNPQGSGTGSWLRSVHFVDAARGWAVGDTGTIVATADGGLTWTAQSSGTGGGLLDLCFLDTVRGWGISSGAIWATADGGLSWAADMPAALGPASLAAVDFVDAGHGWVVGTEGSILGTADGGATWTAQESGTTFDLSGVDFVDIEHGWAVGELPIRDVLHPRPIIVATTDGGTTWTAQDLGAAGEVALCDVDFVDPAQGWAVGTRGTILTTSDGGATWVPQVSGTVARLTAVAFADALHGCAVGYRGGNSGHFPVICTTTDGGVTWTACEPAGIAGVGLEDVDFTDALHGWVVGEHGAVVATTDGGRTWTVQNSGSSYGFMAVDFVDELHGWVDGGGALATASGGWPDATPPTTTVSGADELWHNTPVALTFAAVDNEGGSGMLGGRAMTEYAVDDGQWLAGNDVTISAPSDHSNDGVHSVTYRSVDWAGNVEQARTESLRIDTEAPLATLPATQRANGGFTVTVDDALSPTCTLDVQIFKAGARGAAAHGKRGGGSRLVAAYSVKVACGPAAQQVWLPAGLHARPYLLEVTTTDLAGNAQNEPAVGELRLR